MAGLEKGNRLTHVTTIMTKSIENANAFKEGLIGGPRGMALRLYDYTLGAPSCRRLSKELVMRFSCPSAVIASWLFIILSTGMATAQPSKDEAKKAAELKERLLAEQKELAKQLDQWQTSLVLLQVKLERSPKPSDQQMGKLLKQAVKNVADAGALAEARAILETMPAARFDNAIDLERLFDRSVRICTRLEPIYEVLSSAHGPRMQRQAFEEILIGLKAIAKEQREIETLNLLPDMLAKEQAHLRQKTEKLAAQITAEGKGTGQVGEHLASSSATLQKAIKMQRDLEKSAQNSKLEPRNLRFDLDLTFGQAIAATDAVVRLAVVIEQQIALRDLDANLESKITFLRKVDKDVMDLAKIITRNADKNPDREKYRAALNIGEALRRMQTDLDNDLVRAKADGQAGSVYDGLAAVSLDLRSIASRLEALDLSAEVSTRLTKTIGKIERARRAVKEVREFLGATEPGTLDGVDFKDVADCAMSLHKLILGQRQIGRELMTQWLSLLSSPMILIPAEKKPLPKK